MARFDKEVDPEGVLSGPERARRAGSRKKGLLSWAFTQIRKGAAASRSRQLTRRSAAGVSTGAISSAGPLGMSPPIRPGHLSDRFHCLLVYGDTEGEYDGDGSRLIGAIILNAVNNGCDREYVFRLLSNPQNKGGFTAFRHKRSNLRRWFDRELGQCRAPGSVPSSPCRRFAGLLRVCPSSRGGGRDAVDRNGGCKRSRHL